MRKQKLSAIAKSKKSARDLASANSADRKAKRAENQRLRRDAKKKGKKIDGLDFDHKSRTFKSIKSNRGCLLYTSPSPRDRTRSRMPSSA